MAHIITEIKVQNFKSIKSEVFQLAEYTALLGYNNAGKTNILNAIKWLLRKGSLPKEAFFDANIPVIVEGKISGITNELLSTLQQAHRNSISQYIANGEICIKRVQATPNDSVTNIKLHVKEIPSGTDAESAWKLNPTGIDNALNALFPEPIHIGAMENAEEDVSKHSASSTIGKLIGEIIEPIETKYGEEVRTALTGLKELLDADGTNRAIELTHFDTEVNRKIDSFFPDVNIKLHIPTPELKEVFKKGTIKVYEQPDFGREVSSLGHGAQRSIQMALIRHLADLKKSNNEHSTTTLLLIDEPELYLHPQAIEIIRDSLKTLSSQGYQVVFSTHTPLMISHKDVETSILVRKNPILGTHKKLTLKDAITQIVADSPSQVQLLFSLSNASNILFSEGVILTEGKTEQRIFPKIIEKITGKTLGLHKYALVRQDGGANTKKSKLVLDAMGLPNKAIVDLDYAFKLAITDGFLENNDTDLSACKTVMASLASGHGITLDSDGWPSKRNSAMSPSEAFALLAAQPSIQENISNIHSKLLTNGIWLWKKGSIEAHLGLDGKTEQVWATFVSQLDTQEPETVIADIEGVKGCIRWLFNLVSL